MAADLFTICVIAAAATAWADWRRGILLVILVGTLQDPVRKLTPGAPAILAIAALPVWLAVVVGAYQSDPSLWPRFRKAYPQLAKALGVLVLCLLPPILLVLSYGLGAWRMALLGSFAYLAPVAMVVVGFSFARNPVDVRRLLVFHALYSTLFLAGAWAEFLGFFPESPLLGTGALGVRWMRTRAEASAITLISGLYRSPDLMAWHAATLVMGASTLALAGRRLRDRLWLGCAVWGGACLLMAGRRKALIMPLLFAVSYVLFGLAQRRLARLGAVLVAGSILVGSVLFAAGEFALDAGYLEYAASAVTEASDRFSKGTAGALRETFVQSGILGRGIGSATQGGQHITEPGIERGWQESGASKVLAELGVPGFLCALWLGSLVGRGALRAARRSAEVSVSALPAALIGILLANLASFTVSHQIYGDVVVVTFTATLLGAALSAPRWLAARSAHTAPGGALTAGRSPQAPA